MQSSPDVTEIELPAELIAELDALLQSNTSRSRKWTDREDNAIRYAYAKTNKRALAEWLGVSRETLRKRAVFLGVER